jgi:hypothetical protein
MSAGRATNNPSAAPSRAPEDPESSARTVESATHRLNRLLAEFRLYGGFADPDGMRRWGEIQHTVREVERLRSAGEPGDLP